MTEEHVSVPREYHSYMRSRANQLYREVEAKFYSVTGGLGGGISIMPARRKNNERGNNNSNDAQSGPEQQHDNFVVRGAKDAVVCKESNC